MISHNYTSLGILSDVKSASRQFHTLTIAYCIFFSSGETVHKPAVFKQYQKIIIQFREYDTSYINFSISLYH